MKNKNKANGPGAEMLSGMSDLELTLASGNFTLPRDVQRAAFAELVARAEAKNVRSKNKTSSTQLPALPGFSPLGFK